MSRIKQRIFWVPANEAVEDAEKVLADIGLIAEGTAVSSLSFGFQEPRMSDIANRKMNEAQQIKESSRLLFNGVFVRYAEDGNQVKMFESVEEVESIPISLYQSLSLAFADAVGLKSDGKETQLDPK